MSEMFCGSASLRVEHDKHAGWLYYIKPLARKPPPYKNQRRVEAIIDIAEDGTLAGIELIDKMPPPCKELQDDEN